jgi:hypothetical protein
MEQLINAATPYYYIMIAFWAFGIGIICIGVIIFILSEMTAGKEAFFILILGVLFFIPGVHFGNIFGKYNDQMTAIVKPVISESYPNATDFSYCIDKGSFTENDIEYKIQYKKTVKNEEKLIISVKKQSDDNKDKQIKTLNIPKATSK